MGTEVFAGWASFVGGRNGVRGALAERRQRFSDKSCCLLSVLHNGYCRKAFGNQICLALERVLYLW